MSSGWEGVGRKKQGYLIFSIVLEICILDFQCHITGPLPRTHPEACAAPQSTLMPLP